jgi:hypothetical protein
LLVGGIVVCLLDFQFGVVVVVWCLVVEGDGNFSASKHQSKTVLVPLKNITIVAALYLHNR